MSRSCEEPPCSTAERGVVSDSMPDEQGVSRFGHRVERSGPQWERDSPVCVQLPEIIVERADCWCRFKHRKRAEEFRQRAVSRTRPVGQMREDRGREIGRWWCIKKGECRT